MEGVVDLAEEVFHMPVRLGLPQYISGLVDVVRNPIHATGVGLLLYGKQSLSSGQVDMSSSGKMQSVWDRMKNWFQGNF